MDLSINWDGREYHLDLDSITGKEYEEIEKVTGTLPDDFLTGVMRVEYEVDEDGNPVFQTDDAGEQKRKVARVRMPSGGTARALLWLFLKRDGQAVRLSQVDPPYAKFLKALTEGMAAAVEAQSESDEVEPEEATSSPKGGGTTSTPNGSGSDSTVLSVGS